MIEPVEYIQFKGLKIFFTKSINSSGFFLNDFVLNVVKTAGRKKTYNNIHEYCAGAGFIGFKLLSEHVSSTLTLSEIHEPALQCCEYTIAINQLKSQVSTHQLSRLSEYNGTKCDLFVVNPPFRHSITQVVGDVCPDRIRKKVDKGWNLHNTMWKDISKICTNDCDIFILGNQQYGDPEEDWGTYFRDNNLEIHGIYVTNDNHFIIHLIKI